MLDGIGKDIGLPFAIFLSVLLTAKNNGLRAIDLIDAVNDGIQTLHLLELFSIYVEKILLDGTVRPDSHNDDTGFLIMIAGTDGFLLCHFLIGNTVLAVELSPGTLDDDIIESGFYPRLVKLGKVVGCLHAKGFKSCCIASANAPDFIFRI